MSKNVEATDCYLFGERYTGYVKFFSRNALNERVLWRPYPAARTLAWVWR